MFESLKVSWRQYLAVLLASYGAFCSGILQGWASQVIPKLISQDSPIPNTTLEEILQLTSRVYAGTMTGPFVAAFLSIFIGRRWIIMLVNIPLLLGCVLAAAASNIGTLYVTRVIMGCGMSMHFTILPLYIGEIAEVNVRGALCVCFILFFNMGLFFTSLIGSFASYKGLTAVCGVLTLFNVPASWYIPESPVFLITKGHDKEASEILQKLRCTSEEAVQQELRGLQAMVSRKLRISRGVATAFTVTIFLLVLQYWSGKETILFASQDIFVNAGLDISSYNTNIMMNMLEIAFICVSLFLVDRVGRKPILCLTCVGLLVILVILGVFYMVVYFKRDIRSCAFIPVLCIIAHLILYSLGVGPLSWVLMAEMFPVRMKVFASAISIFMFWLLAFGGSRVFAVLMMDYGLFAGFFLSAAFCLLGFVICFGLLPETKGKSFDEIQDLLDYRRNDAGAVISSPTVVENIHLVSSGLTAPA